MQIGVSFVRPDIGRCLAVVAVAVLFLTFLAPSANGGTLTVTTASDAVAADSVCSLREAIIAANGPGILHLECGTATNPGHDDIVFAIPGLGAKTIVLGPVALPALIDRVTINGLTQQSQGSTASCTAGPLLVAIERTTNDSQILDLAAGASGSIVRGLVLSGGNPGTGIQVLNSTDNRIECNFFNTNTAGTGTSANKLGRGVWLRPGALRNVVGTNGDGINDQNEGNLFTVFQTVIFEEAVGVRIDGDENRIAGNLIGTTITGTAAMPGASLISGGIGIWVVIGDRNVIGTNGDGTSDALERNVVSGLHCSNGQSASGIQVSTLDPANQPTDNWIAGNFVGTNAAGTAAIGNDTGIFCAGTGTLIGTNGDGVADLAERNVISGNVHSVLSTLSRGIILSGTNNRVSGNYIGTNASGTALFPGQEDAVDVQGGINQIVGTNGDGIGDAVEGNLIVSSGANGTGVHIAVSSSGARVSGNRIGTDVSGTIGLSTGSGVLVSGSNNVIGTDGDGVSDVLERNLISGNALTAISMSGANNRIAGNWIGTTASGAAALHNSTGIVPLIGASAMSISGSGNVMGSNDAVPNPVEGNVIVGGTGNEVIVAGGTTGLIVAANTFGSDATGSYGLAGSGSTGLKLSPSATALVRNNRFLFHPVVGVRMESNSSFVSPSRDNCVVDNFDGVTISTTNQGTVMTVFENNWWGATDGPSTPGSGDSRPIPNIDADPFLTTRPAPCRLRAQLPANLSITKTDGLATANAGGTLTYTITVSNLGPNAVTGATVTDVFPAQLAGVTWTCSGTGTCTASGSGNIADSAVNLPVSASVTYTVTAPIAGTATGTVINTAIVTPPLNRLDPVTTNNSATDQTTINASANLAITKTDGLTTAVAGQAVTYTIVASNAGPNPVVGAAVADTLPAELTGATWTCSGAGGGTCPASGSGSLSENVNLPAGGSVTFLVSGTLAGNAAGAIVNNANVQTPFGVTDPTPGNNTATDTTTVTAADLAITKTDGLAVAIPGLTPISYTIVASNSGPNAVVGATVTDTFPAVLTGCTWTCTAAGGGSCSSPGSGNINQLVNLPVGSSVTYAVSCSLSPSATGTLVNTATITSPAGVPDPNTGNNSATDTDTLSPQATLLAVTKTDGVTSVVAGTPTVYTIVVSNSGPSTDPAVTLNDPFPAACSSVTWTCSATPGGTCPAASGSGLMSLSPTTVGVAAGGSVTFLATCNVSPSATGSLSNTVVITSSIPDITNTDNVQSDTDTITKSYDVSVSKTNGVSSVTPGTSTVYSIVASNTGPSEATVGVTDLVPSQCSTFTWTCTAGGGANCPLPGGSGDINFGVTLPPSSSLTFNATCVISANATGTLSNTFFTSTSPFDTNSSNDSATDSDPIVPAMDIVVTKSDGLTTVSPGGDTTYTIAVTNEGPSEGQPTTVNDTFPTGCAAVNWTCIGSSGGSCGTSSGTGNISNVGVTLPVNGVATFTAICTISLTATGTLANTASATNASDPDTSDNSATDTDTVLPLEDIGITKTNSVTSVVAGTPTTYTISVTNNGITPDPAVSVTDIFPTACTSVNWTCSGTLGGSCPAATGSGNLNPAVVGLPAGANVTFVATCNINPAATGSLVNTASIAGTTPDIIPSNNSQTDTDTITYTSDVSASKTNGVTSVVPGTNTVYNMVVANAGPSDALVNFSDTFPPLCSSVNWTCTSGGGASCPAPSGSGDLSYSSVPIPVSGSLTYAATCTVPPTATGNLTNTLQTSTPDDPTSSNDSATDSDPLVPAMDVVVTKTDGVTIVPPGSLTTYTITVTNTGPSEGVATTVDDTFPAACTTVNWTCAGSGGGSCDVGGGSGDIAGVGVTLPVGGTATFLADCTVSPSGSGTMVNTATATNAVDPDTSDNSASDTDTIQLPDDIAITKTDGVSSVIAGTPTIYTIRVTNNGTATDPAVSVTDIFPTKCASVTWTCSGALGGSCPAASGSGNLNPAIVGLPPGASVTFLATCNISPSASGTLVNTASIIGSIPDSVSSNNAQTDSDFISHRNDVSGTKTNGVTSVTPGTNTTYTMVVANAGPSDTEVDYFDTVPALCSSVNWTCIGAGGASCPASGGSANLAETVYVPVNGSLTYTAICAIPPGSTGTLSNTLITMATDGGDLTPGNNSATDSDPLTPAMDIAVTKTNGVSIVNPGGSTTYTITVTNTGPSEGVATTVSDTFPTACTTVNWTCAGSGGGSCGTPAGSGDISAVGVTLPVGGTATFISNCTVSSSATGTLVNTATATNASDPDPSDNSATDTDTIQPPDDIAVTKTNGVSSVVAGTPTTYTITVTNSGTSADPAISLTDVFPAACTSVNWTCGGTLGGSCPAASGSGNLNPAIVGLPPGASVTFLATCNISAAAAGTLVNTATIVGTTSDSVPSNNSQTDTDTITRTSDVSVTKTNGVTIVTPGTSTVYTMSVTNLGPSDALVDYSDDFPALCSSVSWTCTGAGGAGCPAANGAADFAYVAVPIPANGSLTYSATCAVPAEATGTLTNTLNAPAAGDPNSGNNWATDADPLGPAMNIVVTKTDGITAVSTGTFTEYAITVTNQGPSAGQPTTVTDTFPAGCAAVSWTCAGSGGASCGTPSGNGNIAGVVVTLPVGGTATFLAGCTISLLAEGTLVNTVTATNAIDPDTSDNSATDTDTILPVSDLAVTMSDGMTTATPGQSVTYTVVASNGGPSADLAATVLDSFPAACSTVNWTCTSTGGGVCPAPGGSGNLANVVIGLPVGGTVTFAATCNIAASATGPLVNTVELDSSGDDPETANDVVTDTDTLAPVTDLTITKSDGVTTAIPGETVTYVITVSNSGPSDETDAQVSDTFPAACSSVSWTCSGTGGGSCTVPSGAGNLTGFSVGVPAGGAVTFTATCTISPTATGMLSNTASVSSPRDASAGNSATDGNTQLLASNDVRIVKTATSPTGINGAPIGFVVTVSNDGPSDAIGVIVTDTLPPSLANATWTCSHSSGATCTTSGAGNINDVVNIPVGGSVVYTITAIVNAPAGTQIVNSANAAAGAGTNDPNPGNNQGSAMIEVGADIPAVGDAMLVILALLLGVTGWVLMSRRAS